MKVPTKMLGKGRPDLALLSPEYRLNESPPKKEGKFAHHQSCQCRSPCLNESPSKKEGKFTEQRGLFLAVTKPSMKVPPKRKGNLENILAARNNTPPQ